MQLAKAHELIHVSLCRQDGKQSHVCHILDLSILKLWIDGEMVKINSRKSAVILVALKSVNCPLKGPTCI